MLMTGVSVNEENLEEVGLRNRRCRFCGIWIGACAYSCRCDWSIQTHGNDGVRRLCKGLNRGSPCGRAQPKQRFWFECRDRVGQQFRVGRRIELRQWIELGQWIRTWPRTWAW